MLEGFYFQPPTHDQVCRAARALREKYPFLKVFPIGRSVLGREIYALGVGKLCEASLFVAGVHGSEWLTVLLLLRFLEDILSSIASGRPLADICLARTIEARSLLVVPCLNPDGVEISICGAQSAKHLSGFVEKASRGDTVHWQANARGVDLNHNFDAGFPILKEMERQAGFTSPGPTRYGGILPHSEPETKALAECCKAFRFRQAYAFHSQGEETYYHYGPHTPARSQLMAQVLAAACGYRPAEPEGLASHGGFKDWFIDKMHRPGFTIEIGRGKNPLPIEELEPIYARLLEMMLIAMLL